MAHAVPGVRRYVQNHIEGERARADIPTTEIVVDGIAELWYDDRAAMDRANASPEAKRLHDDGALFIGSPQTVAAKIVEVARGLRLSRFHLKYSLGTLPHEQLLNSIRLYATEVAPLVREQLGSGTRTALPGREVLRTGR